MTSIQRRKRAQMQHLGQRVGLRGRLRVFFEANPDDDVTIEQLALKFGAKASSVRTELHRLKAEGVVAWASVWRFRPIADMEGTLEERMHRERVAQERAEREAARNRQATEVEEAQHSLFGIPEAL